MRSRLLAASAAATLLLLAGACGEDAEERSSSLDARLVERLPKQQYNLIEYVCPRSAGIDDGGVQEQRRRRGVDMLAALKEAYRQAPDAMVATQYTPAHEPGVRREEISVRQLVETHIEGLSEDFGVADQSCLKRHRRELRTLMSNG